MKNIFSNTFLAFIGRLAIICNVFTVVSLLFMFFKWFKLPGIVASYSIELGFVIGPIVNICFLLWLAGMKLIKQKALTPQWQTIVIVFMLIVQLCVVNR